jgi:hypothetical protein
MLILRCGCNADTKPDLFGPYDAKCGQQQATTNVEIGCKPRQTGIFTTPLASG